MNLIFYNRYQSGLADIVSSNTLSLNQWHCIWLTEDSNWGKVFLDWNTSAVWTNNTTRTFPNLTDNVWIFCYQDNWVQSNPSNWYASNLVIMNSSITVNDFLYFYHSTLPYSSSESSRPL